MDTHSINETASHAKSAEDNGEATASWNGGARLEVIANLAHELTGLKRSSQQNV